MHGKCASSRIRPGWCLALGSGRRAILAADVGPIGATHGSARFAILEIGCGAGRVSVHLIRFLLPGRYSCIEVDAWSLYAQISYELPLAGLLHRRPRFSHIQQWAALPSVDGLGGTRASSDAIAMTTPAASTTAAPSQAMVFVDATNIIGRGLLELPISFVLAKWPPALCCFFAR